MSATTSSTAGHLRLAPGSETPNTVRRIGMLAGWGRYPVLLVEALRRQGYEVYCLGVVGHADPQLAEICTEFRWTGLGRFGFAIRYFKRHGATDAIMAGKIHKVLLFQPWRLVRHVPDLRTIRMFIPHFLTRRADCRDDTILTTICKEFASEGIRFGPATDYAPELLVGGGVLTRRSPTAAQRTDIEFGWRMAKEMGRLDVGQSVAIKDQAVLAVEAVEGTDECIRRAGKLCSQGGFTVVKVAKPQQDMRFDVPTIGLGTLKTLIESGGRTLAIEAHRTILLDGPDTIDYADRQGIAIVAMDDAQTGNPKA